MNETTSTVLGFLNHVIVGDDKYFSFAEKCLTAEFKSLLRKADVKLKSILNRKARAVVEKITAK